jgi:hypothetical protein
MTKNRCRYRNPSLPQARAYCPPDDWLELDAERENVERTAMAKHLDDLRAHQSPLKSLRILEGIPQGYRRVCLP